MMNKVLAAASLTLVFGGSAFADTPIGPGVTGSGGTGATTADCNVRAGAGGEPRVVRQDGMAAERADANVRADELCQRPFGVRQRLQRAGDHDRPVAVPQL